ncbi:type II secretion system F family protein [Arthrobacter roseus]|uniref:type II secretion system F family protein n=1 Tax=Arthrobacter roseus TaxID=136274 RepID=UPI0019647454|nr:type II secretion system F family protein [Arthrobacter roseus]MBM7849543.1 tight adherence protein B [Arthrobacter roseus]
MTGILVALLTSLACLLLVYRATPGTTTVDRRSASRTVFGPSTKQPATDPHDLPLFVHQLAALLQSGRNPHSLWQDALSVYASADNNVPASGRGLGANVIPVLEHAAQAAALGLSPSNTLIATATACREQKQHHLAGLWMDLAACLNVSERCGAPLGNILARYAVQLEARLDSAAARETALAGPKATVRLLTWLPVFGLGLGFLMGMNPIAILLGTPAGWAFLFAGITLMIVGRWWSGKLVAGAGKETFA